MTLNLTGGATMSTSTDANGTYAFAGLFNGQYTVTPTKSGVSFAPASQVVTITAANATANFTASSGIAIDAVVPFGRSTAEYHHRLARVLDHGSQRALPRIYRERSGFWHGFGVQRDGRL